MRIWTRKEVKSILALSNEFVKQVKVTEGSYLAFLLFQLSVVMVQQDSLQESLTFSFTFTKASSIEIKEFCS